MSALHLPPTNIWEPLYNLWYFARSPLCHWHVLQNPRMHINRSWGFIAFNIIMNRNRHEQNQCQFLWAPHLPWACRFNFCHFIIHQYYVSFSVCKGPTISSKGDYLYFSLQKSYLHESECSFDLLLHLTLLTEIFPISFVQ